MHSKWKLLLVTLVWSCTSPSGPPEFAVTAALNQPFELTVGQSARLEEAGLELRFVEVAGDSRCPSNALISCVWEGDGAVVVELTSADVSDRTDTLHTTIDPKEVEVGSFVLRLDSLEPYPEDVSPIPVDEYVASFVLTATS